MAKSKLEKLFGIKPKQLPPIDEMTKENLRILSERINKKVKEGEEYRKTSKKLWGVAC